MGPVNRIADLVGPHTPAGRPQPTGRADAARANGAKSRGPRTAEGKRRSSRNALKHGLLARRVAPPTDHRGERADYDEHLRGLLREYRPKTRTELNLVESLARDFVRLARIGQYTETLMDPGPAASGGPLPPPYDVHAERRRLSVARRMLDDFEAGRPFDLPADDAVWAAAELARVGEDLLEAARFRREFGSDYDPDDAAAGGPDSLMARARVCRLVRPRGLGLLNAERVGGFVTGERAVPAGDHARWHAVLRELVRRAEASIEYAERQVERHERQLREHQRPVIRRLDELRLPLEYEQRVRRSIEQTVATLVQLGQLRRRPRRRGPTGGPAAALGSFDENGRPG